MRYFAKDNGNKDILPAYIIDKLRKDQEKRKEQDYNRVPLPLEEPIDDSYRPPKDDGDKDNKDSLVVLWM